MTAPILAATPIVEENRTMAREFQDWVRRANLSAPIVGTGSPEGVVDDADQYALYLDDAGAAGSIQYRKMLPDIGGDKTKGWLLV